jgi:hypothetical protein
MLLFVGVDHQGAAIPLLCDRQRILPWVSPRKETFARPSLRRTRTVEGVRYVLASSRAWASGVRQPVGRYSSAAAASSISSYVANGISIVNHSSSLALELR